MPDVNDRRLDLRGLEPPQPMVRSLEAADELLPGEELLIVTDRRPVYLLPLLVERGFEIAPTTLADRHETLVRKPARA